MQSRTDHKYLNSAGEVKEVYSPDNPNLAGSGSATTYSHSDHTHGEVSTTAKGFMSSADKVKLNGIEAGAQKNVTPTKQSVNGYTRANFLAGKLTFPEIQDIVRLGLAKEVFDIDDTIYCNHDEYGGGVIGWKVVAFNKEDLVVGGTSAPSMTLLMDKAYFGNLIFDNGISGDSNYSYGCNCWENADIRLWLNSKKLPGNPEETNIPGWWDKSKKVITGESGPKVPPSSLINKYGFLHGIDPGFEAILATVKKITANNTSTLGGGSRVTQDKIFLPSYTELGFGQNNSISEGQVYDKFTSAGTNSSTLRVIKDEKGSAVYLWMRSAITSTPYGVRGVYTDGNWYYNNAYDTYDSPVPACVIG